MRIHGEFGMNRGLAVLLGGAVVLTFAACGASPANTTAPTGSAPAASAPAASEAPPSAAAGGTGHVTVPEAGFAIDLPDGWRQIPLDPAGIKEVVDQLSPDSELGKMLASQEGQLAAAGVKFWAMDLTDAAVASGFASNVNIILDTAPGAPISGALDSVLGQYQGDTSFSEVDGKVVTLPAGEAVRAVYRLTQAMADGSTTEVAGTQFYIASSAHLYIVSVTCLQSEADGCRAKADAMMQSFEFTGG